MVTNSYHIIQALVHSLKQLHRDPIKTWFSVLLHALIMSMPIGLYITASHLEHFSFLIQQHPQAAVFLSHDAEHSIAMSTQHRILELDHVQAARLVSADEALAEFEELTGLYSISNYLQENPFPATIQVDIAAAFSNPQEYDTLLSQIQRLDYVDLVQFDYEWAAKLSSIRSIIKLFGPVIIVLMGLTFLTVILLIISMSQRQVDGRTDEIKLLSYLGAKRRLIYRPFVYTAVFQSLFIFITTFVIVESFRAFSRQSIADLMVLYQFDVSVAAIEWNVWGIVLLSLTLLNVLSVRIAVYLRAREF